MNLSGPVWSGGFHLNWDDLGFLRCAGCFLCWCSGASLLGFFWCAGCFWVFRWCWVFGGGAVRLLLLALVVVLEGIGGFAQGDFGAGLSWFPGYKFVGWSGTGSGASPLVVSVLVVLVVVGCRMEAF